MNKSWTDLEQDAAAKISAVMTMLNVRRWAKATLADRKRQGERLAAGRRKAQKARGRSK